MKSVNSTTEKDNTASGQLTGYKEVKIGRTIYKVTNIYLNEIDLKETLEELIIRNALSEIDKEENAAFATAQK